MILVQFDICEQNLVKIPRSGGWSRFGGRPAAGLELGPDRGGKHNYVNVGWN